MRDVLEFDKAYAWLHKELEAKTGREFFNDCGVNIDDLPDAECEVDDKDVPNG